jgi:hypothetical protein
LVALLVGAALTGALLWLVLGGANVWRRAAWPDGGAPDGGVRIQFYRPKK